MKKVYWIFSFCFIYQRSTVVCSKGFTVYFLLSISMALWKATTKNPRTNLLPVGL